MKHPNFEKVYGPDTVSILKFIWPTLLLAVIFLLSFIGLAWYDTFIEWMDKTFDKSDQQKTGIVLLFLFTLCFGTCLRLAAKK